MMEWFQEWGALTALVLSMVGICVAVWSVRSSNQSAKVLEAVLERLDVRADEQASLHLGSNRKLRGIASGIDEVAEHSGRLVEHAEVDAQRRKTELKVSTGENLSIGCVDVKAYAVGLEALLVTGFKVLYRDGSSLAPRYGSTYPVRLDASQLPENAEINGPWVKLGAIEPPLLMEEAIKRGGLRGISIETSDGKAHIQADCDLADKLGRHAAKALQTWLKFND